MTQEPQTVLLVEDNAPDVLLFQTVLSRTGVARPIQVVVDGESAQAYLQGIGAYANREKHPFPSLVFLDLNLPGRSGFEVLTWMRQESSMRKLPVVVLTGSSKTIDIYRAYELGATSYLVKPVQLSALDDLSKTLHLGWLRRRRSSTAAEGASPSTSFASFS